MNREQKWLILALFIGLMAVIGLGRSKIDISSKIGIGSPEIKAIKSLTNVNDQSVELKKLLERVGPAEAQEEMLRSGMPFTGETHLLIHVIGDFIYDNYGSEGLSLCKDYFLSACYHGFIINTLGDHGMKGMVEAMDNCEEAGPGVLPQCAHAAGHGFVAWHDYDLVKGARMCDELGAGKADFPYFNCYDGVFMENVWGVHNGAPSEKRWVNPNDIYYPCNDKRIPEKYLAGCWSNQATLIYQYNKGNLREVALACDKVENEFYKDTCYNNFARQIHPLTKGEDENVINMCANAPNINRQEECVIANVNAAWSVGDRKMPFELCQTLTEQESECFSTLVNQIKFYYKNNPDEKRTYCNMITDKVYRDQCNA